MNFLQVSQSVVDDKDDVTRHFSKETLKQLFVLNESTVCETHDLVKANASSDPKSVPTSDWIPFTSVVDVPVSSFPTPFSSSSSSLRLGRVLSL